MKLFSFSSKTVDAFSPKGEFASEKIELVNDERAAKRVLDYLWKRAEKRKAVAVDSEFDPHAAEDENPIQCWSLSADDNHRVVISAAMLHMFKDWLEEERAPKIFQNFMADEEVFDAAEITVRGLHADTMVQDFLVDESDPRHGLKWAVEKWLKQQMIGNFTDVFSYVPPGKKKAVVYPWSEIRRDHQLALVLYSADDPAKTRLLYKHHRHALEARGYWETYLSEDLPFTLSLINMSKRGMPIDMDRMYTIRALALMALARADHVFRARSGKPDINLRSVPQLKKLFFEELGLPELKQTKGEKDKHADTATAMDAEVLDRWSELRKSHKTGARLAEVLLTIRQMNTLKGTFIEGIINGVETDNRLYSSFNQIGAVTGRISSRKYTEEYEETYELKNGEERTRVRKRKKGANLQNMPARVEKDPFGIRGAFIASVGYKLVVVDKAGFEWWLMAHWSEDPVMLRQSKEKFDPHGQTATRFFSLPCKLEDWKTTLSTYDELKKKYKRERNDGKTGNFGFIYGCQAEKAAKMLGTTDLNKAQRYLDTFFELYKGIVDYHYRMVDMARTKGYVQTISGRRIHLNEIDSENNGMRYHEENRAKNGPIQGSAGDIIKAITNMVEFGPKYLKMYPPTGDRRKVAQVYEAAERCEYIRRKLGARLLNQVHDELIWEAPEEHAAEVLEHAIFICEHERYSPIMLVDLPAEGSIASDWKSAK